MFNVQFQLLFERLAVFQMRMHPGCFKVGLCQFENTGSLDLIYHLVKVFPSSSFFVVLYYSPNTFFGNICNCWIFFYFHGLR